MRNSCFILFFLLLTASCRTIEPLAPQTLEQSAPMPEQPLSTIVLPVAVDLTEYYKMADNEVPKQFEGREQQCEGTSFSYHFERNPIELNGNRRSIDITVTGKYRIKINYCPECTDIFTDEPHCIIPRVYLSCGYDEPMRRMRLKYTTQFALTPDYGLETKTGLTELKAIDPCEVSFLHFDATDRLLDEARKSLGKLAKDIDKETAKVSFKPQASGFWHKASEPFEVPGYGFVQLRPVDLSCSQPVIRGNVLNTTLVLRAKPLFSTSRPEAVSTPLPSLQLADSIPNDTLRLISDLHLQYDSLSAIITHFAGGQHLKIHDRDVIIDSIRITGANNRKLIFKVAFSGYKRGVLFIEGQPVFNAALQQIELTNVDFDLETKSTLLKTAKWLFSDRILEAIAKSSKQDLGPQLDRLLAELNKSLRFEQNGFIVSGKVSHLHVEQIYPETDRLIVRVAAKGRLGVTNIRN